MTRLLLCLLALAPALAQAYPIDGYPYTGIRRLLYTQEIFLGTIDGRKQQPGQYLMLEQVQPRWHASSGSTLPPPDAELGQRLGRFIDAGARSSYGIALLDLTDPAAPVYAEHQGGLQANVGSVAKILVALAVFQELANLYPKDIAARERVLKDTRVIADDFSQYDHHKVPFWDPEKRHRASRQIRVGDEANLWEFMDWMLSASSNSAGAMVQKELIALKHFGAAYPPPRDVYDAFFKQATPAQLGDLHERAMVEAIARNGLDPAQIRQGSLFTHGGNRHVASRGGSFATPEQLVRFMFRMEAGTLVDAFSSREIKRLLYLTQRRIRYASHPALNDAAVYFKSGSFFQCSSPCAKYKGDKTNRLASVADVEWPAGKPAQHYIVAVMSNVLRVNSAVAHQTLAMRIQRMLQERHPLPQAEPLPPESSYPVVPVDDPDDPATPGNAP